MHDSEIYTREAYEALSARFTKRAKEQQTAQDRVIALEAALRKYGQHTDECRVNNGMRRWCTCGLNAALGLPDHTPEAFASDAEVKHES